MRTRALSLLFFLSGTTGLVYETVWTRLLILLFGSSVLGISAIVAAFLGGLALGGLVFGRRADRMLRPLRVYGVFEIGIGLYAAILPWIFEALLPLLKLLWTVSGESYEIFGLFRFALACVLLLAPTVLMGASLPLLSAATVRSEGSHAAAVGSLYGWNTLGAVVGTLVAGFVLLPWLGVRGASWFCALGNILIGLWALRWAREAGPVSPPACATPEIAGAAREDAGLLAIAAVGGFAALVLEVCWSRMLGTIYGSSLYGFCITLATFLVGIALGSLWISKRLRSQAARFLDLALCQAGIAVGALLGFFLVREIVFWNFSLQPALRDTPWAWFGLRYLASSFIVLIPTFLMGVAFPVTIGLLRGNPRAGESAGRVYGWSTLGSIAGSFTAGFFLLPWLGLESSMLAATGLFALLALLVVMASFWHRENAARWQRPALASVAILGVFAALLRPAWNPGMLSAGGIYFRQIERVPRDREDFFASYEGAENSKKRLFYRDGRNASVGVYESSHGAIYLEVSGKVDASTSRADMPTQVLSGLIPLLAPQRPREALVIGCGSGTTLGVLTQNPDLQRIDLVELEKAVVEAASFFLSVNLRGLSDPRVRVFENDGRNHLLLGERRYDLIVSEPSNPWMSGAANLFTSEFFRLARSRLTEKGLFAQWLQLYSIEPAELRTLLRTLLAEFPQSLVFQLNEVDLVIVSWVKGPPQIDVDRLFQAFEHPVLGPTLRKILASSEAKDSGDPSDLLGHFRLDPSAAAAFAGEGPRNTDDNLLIETRTPFSLFQLTNQRNREEIDRFPAVLRPYLLFPEDKAQAQRLRAQLAEGFRRRGQDRLAREMGE